METLLLIKPSNMLSLVSEYTYNSVSSMKTMHVWKIPKTEIILNHISNNFTVQKPNKFRKI